MYVHCRWGCPCARWNAADSHGVTYGLSCDKWVRSRRGALWFAGRQAGRQAGRLFASASTREQGAAASLLAALGCPVALPQVAAGKCGGMQLHHSVCFPSNGMWPAECLLRGPTRHMRPMLCKCIGASSFICCGTVRFHPHSLLKASCCSLIMPLSMAGVLLAFCMSSRPGCGLCVRCAAAALPLAGVTPRDGWPSLGQRVMHDVLM